MGKIKHPSGRAMSIPAGVAVGVGTGMCIMLAGAAILAWLLSSERLAMEASGYVIGLIHILASAVGSLVTVGAVKHQKLLVCACSCGGYYLALLLTALLFGGGFTGLGVTALMVLLGGGITMILGMIGNKGGAARRKIRAYR